MHVLSPVPTIVVRNCKNIRNRPIRSDSVISSSSNVESFSKPAYYVASSSDSVINISKSLNPLPMIHILLIPVHLRRVFLAVVIVTINVSCIKGK